MYANIKSYTTLTVFNYIYTANYCHYGVNVTICNNGMRFVI